MILTLQKIKAEIVITIPDDMVLITKVEYEELKQQELIGVYWSMKDIEKRINKKSDWIKGNLFLYPECKRAQYSRYSFAH
jgi:phage pi2 protein 07